MTEEHPPSFEPVNNIELFSTNESKISSIRLYGGRAEVTRTYKFTIKTGQNQVTIKGLPNALDDQSLRVEGRGSATIHDVTISRIPQNSKLISPTLTELTRKKTLIQKAQERCQRSLKHLETYIGSLSLEHVASDLVTSVMDDYDRNGAKLEDQLLDLTVQLEVVNKELSEEQARLAPPLSSNQLGKQAAVGVFADFEGEVELALKYAVYNASWSARYDIRVNMQTKENPVTLIYKAAIAQSTGESWDEVPLTLETATPSFGTAIPTLDSWNLSLYRPTPPPQPRASLFASVAPRARTAKMAISSAEDEEESDDDMGFGLFDDGPPAPMAYLSTGVSSKGHVNATFDIPGRITIPSDGQAHNFTIVQLSLNADMAWVAVPKRDTQVHLKAKITNASEYTLLSGPASVYVDGSFISRSDVPGVSPQESFDCPLGLDPSIRITYHPRNKKVSQSGFYSKSSNYVFTQRITIHNTKTQDLNGLKILDQVPTSEESQITVKVISPALPTANSQTNTGTSTIKKLLTTQVKVGDGVVAMWEGADDTSVDPESLGKDGKFNWNCNVPAQGKVNLNLQWEISSPAKSDIVGL